MVSTGGFLVFQNLRLRKSFEVNNIITKVITHWEESAICSVKGNSGTTVEDISSSRLWKNVSIKEYHQ